MAFVFQQIVRDLGGTIEIQLPVRPDASPAPTVSVVGSDGSVYVDGGTASVDSVNTTLGIGANKGESTVAVASATGITVGREYLVGDGSLSPKEMVRVKGISGVQIRLYRPLINAHKDGAGFVGTRLSFGVTAAQASSLFFDGHILWNWAESGGGSFNRKTYQRIECVLKGQTRLATVQDWQRLDPELLSKLPATADPEEYLDRGWEKSMLRLGGKFRVRTLVGSDSFIEPTLWRASYDVAKLYGPDWAETRAFYKQEWEQSLQEVIDLTPADLNQDGQIQGHEKGYNTIKVHRA